jgi:hypothetical protein
MYCVEITIPLNSYKLKTLLNNYVLFRLIFHFMRGILSSMNEHLPHKRTVIMTTWPAVIYWPGNDEDRKKVKFSLCVTI